MPGRRTVRRAAAATAALLSTAGLSTAGLSTTGLAVTGASSPALAASRSAQPTTPTWKIVKRIPNGNFSVVITVGKSSGWAFDNGFASGSVPTAWRRSGSSWTRVPFPGKSNETVVAAAAISPADVWAFTDGLSSPSRALRWNGRSWTVQRSFSQQIGGQAVIGPGDVWVFGQPSFPGAGFGAWHYNGRSWSHVASGHGLEGGSGLSANDVWAFDGADVAHWNGSTWSRTSVAALLPAKQQLNSPGVTGVFAQSKNSVYAIGTGGAEDEGGPQVILHWNGHRWSKVAGGSFGLGDQPEQQISPDGHGGLWLPMPGIDGQKSYLLHYSAGHLTPVALPGGPSRISLYGVALIPGTSSLLAGGFTHAPFNPGANVTAVLLQYEP